MNQKGFTLMELLVTVMILGILTSIAVPQYMRSLERARATEAMTGLKALNDAVYAYAAGRPGFAGCPTQFKKLSVTMPGSVTTVGGREVLRSKDFEYTLNAATGALIPGTDCPGVTAKRLGVAKYDYVIWNPFIKGTSGKGASLACFSPDNLETSRAVCDSLDLYTAGATPYASVN